MPNLLHRSSLRLALVLLAAAPAALAAACSSSGSSGGGGTDAGDDAAAADGAGGSSGGGSSSGTGSSGGGSGASSSGSGGDGGADASDASSSADGPEGGNPDASDGGGSVPEGGRGSADAGEAGSASDGGDGGEAGAACNALVNTAPIVSTVDDSAEDASIPSFSGGVLTDGTYYLTALIIYPSDGGSPFYVTRWQETVVITGNTYDVVQKIDDGDGDLGFDMHSSYTLVASGGNLTLTPTCGTTAHSGPMPYTATNPDGGKATFYMEIDSAVVAYFTQQ